MAPAVNPSGLFDCAWAARLALPDADVLDLHGACF
jgi:hypothetical protein